MIYTLIEMYLVLILCSLLHGFYFGYVLTSGGIPTHKLTELYQLLDTFAGKKYPRMWKAVLRLNTYPGGGLLWAWGLSPFMLPLILWTQGEFIAWLEAGMPHSKVACKHCKFRLYKPALTHTQAALDNLLDGHIFTFHPEHFAENLYERHEPTTTPATLDLPESG